MWKLLEACNFEISSSRKGTYETHSLRGQSRILGSVESDARSNEGESHHVLSAEHFPSGSNNELGENEQSCDQQQNLVSPPVARVSQNAEPAPSGRTEVYLGSKSMPYFIRDAVEAVSKDGATPGSSIGDAIMPILGLREAVSSDIFLFSNLS